MKMIVAAFALLACVAAAGSQTEGASSPVPGALGEKPVASPLFGLVDFVPQTILDYCKSAAPELRAELTDESARFSAKSHRAVARYEDRLAADGATVAGLSDTELDATRQMMLASLAKNEPHSYCSPYVVKLRDADVDAFAAAWNKYQALTEAVKARGAQ